MATTLIETFSPVAFFLPRYEAFYKKHGDRSENMITRHYSEIQIDGAFTKAMEDLKGARSDVQRVIKKELGRDARRVKIDSLDFVEFDSGNVTHANAVYHVVLAGPPHLLRSVRSYFGYKSEDLDEPA